MQLTVLKDATPDPKKMDDVASMLRRKLAREVVRLAEQVERKWIVSGLIGGEGLQSGLSDLKDARRSLILAASAIDATAANEEQAEIDEENLKPLTLDEALRAIVSGE